MDVGVVLLTLLLPRSLDSASILSGGFPTLFFIFFFFFFFPCTPHRDILASYSVLASDDYDHHPSSAHFYLISQISQGNFIEITTKNRKQKTPKNTKKPLETAARIHFSFPNGFLFYS